MVKLTFLEGFLIINQHSASDHKTIDALVRLLNGCIFMGRSGGSKKVSRN